MKRAVYKDQRGQKYSAPIVFQYGQWLMKTSEGLAPVTLQFDDDQGGRLEFVEDRDEPDSWLHVEDRGFRALQEAGAQATLQYQTQREQRRRAMLGTLNQPNAAKIAEARANATALAQRWHTHREVIPPPVLSKENIGALAEDARYRKRKTEPES